jgi:hypothetical protein
MYGYVYTFCTEVLSYFRTKVLSYESTFVLSYFRTYENTTFVHVHTTCKLLILVPCLISSGTKVPSYFRTCLLYQLHTVPSYKSTTATAIPIKSIFTSVDMRFQNSGFHVTVTISIDNYCILRTRTTCTRTRRVSTRSRSVHVSVL